MKKTKLMLEQLEQKIQPLSIHESEQIKGGITNTDIGGM